MSVQYIWWECLSFMWYGNVINIKWFVKCSFSNESSTLCGDVLLNRYQFDTFNVWWNFLIIIAMSTTTLVFGFVGLLCITRQKWTKAHNMLVTTMYVYHLTVIFMQLTTTFYTYHQTDAELSELVSKFVI